MVTVAEIRGSANQENAGRPSFSVSRSIPSEFNAPVPPSPPPAKENLLLNLICNIAVPTLVLTKLSGERTLGPGWGMIVALAFPVGYGLYDYHRRRRANFISIVGFVSVLLTGGLNFLKVGGVWFAVKEAAVPLIIGAAVLLSVRTKTPLVKEMIYNEQLMDINRINAALVARGNEPAFARLLARSSYWLGGGFVMSAALNFGLARYLLKSPPGTTEFNAELGRMHMLSWPVIVVPSMIVMMLAFWKLLSGLKGLTGLTTDELFHPVEEKKSAAPSKP